MVKLYPSYEKWIIEGACWVLNEGIDAIEEYYEEFHNGVDVKKKYVEFADQLIDTAFCILAKYEHCDLLKNEARLFRMFGDIRKTVSVEKWNKCIGNMIHREECRDKSGADAWNDCQAGEWHIANACLLFSVDDVFIENIGEYIIIELSIPAMLYSQYEDDNMVDISGTTVNIMDKYNYYWCKNTNQWVSK